MTGTFACETTPPGKAALTTLELIGPRSWEVVRELFVPRSGQPLPEQPPAGRFWLGRFGQDLADEAVLAVRRTTPVCLLALHCHGGREVTRYLLELLGGRSVSACDRETFARLEYDDPIRAAAAVALARAPTPRTAAILLDQYHGALRNGLERIEAAALAGDVAAAPTMKQQLRRWANVGRHLLEPFRVVIAGAPNVGKSSLVNALAGYQRSIVSPLPGTTRDVVTICLAIDGWPVEIADTAGLRWGAQTLEQLGIEQAREAIRRADLCLWLVDAGAVPVWPGVQDERLRIVVNKIDLPLAWDVKQAEGALRVSATTGQGILELCEAISRALVPQPPPPGTAVPFTTEQLIALEDEDGMEG